MDEKAWDACGDPGKMLEVLRSTGKLSDRKARLFACAAVRRLWHLLTDERSRRAVEVAENYADGMADAEELKRAAAVAFEVYAGAAAGDLMVSGFLVASQAAEDGPERFCGNVAFAIADAIEENAGWSVAMKGESAEHCRLLRDIFGPLPFRPLPPLERPVRAWNDGLILKLAAAIYDQRKLPEGTLCSVRLGILADALEEAGVTDQDVLGHLRQQGVHVAGCFALDWLLGKS